MGKSRSRPKKKKSASKLINLDGVSDKDLYNLARGLNEENVLLYTQLALRTLRSSLLLWLQQVMEVNQAAVKNDKAVKKRKRTSKKQKEASTKRKEAALDEYNSEVALIETITTLLTGAIVEDAEDARLCETPTGDEPGNVNPPPSTQASLGTSDTNGEVAKDDKPISEENDSEEDEAVNDALGVSWQGV